MFVCLCCTITPLHHYTIRRQFQQLQVIYCTLWLSWKQHHFTLVVSTLCLPLYLRNVCLCPLYTPMACDSFTTPVLTLHAVPPSAASGTDLLPAVIGLSVALFVVTVLFAVAIFIIVLLFIRESHCTSTWCMWGVCTTFTQKVVTQHTLSPGGN